MIDPQQELQREMVRRMCAETGLDLTNLARQAGVAASTLTRFMNKPVKNLLSARTIAKLERVAGRQQAEPIEADNLPKSARLRAVAAVAEALDVSPAEVAALDERVVRWIEVIQRIPSEIEGNALSMLRGLVSGAPTQQTSSPRKRLQGRRKS